MTVLAHDEPVTVPEIGKYHLIAELARGGMGQVYLAVAQGPGGFSKLLAVKELRLELTEDESYVAMFLDEARLAARLVHPNIVQTYEVGSDGLRHYMVMEFLDGRSLHRVVRRFAEDGGLPVGAHLRIISEALMGLHHAHELRDFDGEPLGIVHRDVSPLNVFVTFDGQTKVVDFGIAKAVDSSLETKTGVLKGRVAYMAPEQAWGQKVDRRADLYSAGVMIWEAVAGRRLWPGMTELEILSHVLREPPPPLRSICPDVPEELEAICARAMSKVPDERYATATEMIDALEKHLSRRSDAMSMREIAAVMRTTFADERRKMNTIVEETVSRVRLGPRSGVMPTFEAQVVGTRSGNSLEPAPSIMSGEMSVLPGRTHPSSLRDLAVAISRAPFPASSPPSSGPSPAESQVRVPEFRTSLRSRATRAAVVAGVAMSAFAVYLASARTENAPATGAAAGSSPAPALVTAPAVAVPPTFVDVVVKAQPLTAQITIDGAPSPSNPFHARLAKDGQVHRVSVSADGYEGKTQDVAFTNDVSLDLYLERVAPRRPSWVAPPVQFVRAPVRRMASPPANAAPSPPLDVPAASSPPARSEVNAGGGRPPLRPIVSNNPYGGT